MKADGPLPIVYLKSNMLTYESESGNQRLRLTDYTRLTRFRVMSAYSL